MIKILFFIYIYYNRKILSFCKDQVILYYNINLFDLRKIVDLEIEEENQLFFFLKNLEIIIMVYFLMVYMLFQKKWVVVFKKCKFVYFGII